MTAAILLKGLFAGAVVMAVLWLAERGDARLAGFAALVPVVTLLSFALLAVDRPEALRPALVAALSALPLLLVLLGSAFCALELGASAMAAVVVGAASWLVGALIWLAIR